MTTSGSKECCGNCRRWSKTKSAYIRIAWCMKQRKATKKDSLCGYYEPEGDVKQFNEPIE